MSRRAAVQLGPAWRLAAILGTLATVLPICVMAGLSIWYMLLIAAVANAATLSAAWRAESGIGAALANSTLIAISAALLATAGGFCLAAAWEKWLARRRFGLLTLSLLPAVMPAGALGATLLIAFLFLSRLLPLDLGVVSVALGQAIAAAPWAALVLHLRWRRIDPHLRLAALEAGADDRAILREITLPLLRPALVAAGLICCLFSLADFHLGNSLSGATPILSSVVLSGLASGQSPLYPALIAIAMIPVVVFAILIERLLRQPIG